MQLNLQLAVCFECPDGTEEMDFGPDSNGEYWKAFSR